MPKCSIARKILLPRPDGSSYQRPITAWLFFAPPAEEIIQCTEIILDFPGGGFVAMNPAHHEDRLRAWAVRTRRPVVAIDYGKAPEYPYPFAAEEAYDAYMALTATHGRLLGLAGNAPLDVIMHGDSAGATIAVNAMLRILERGGPRPRALILTYAALDFKCVPFSVLSSEGLSHGG
jgi:acetyl esterase/lipase